MRILSTIFLCYSEEEAFKSTTENNYCARNRDRVGEGKWGIGIDSLTGNIQTKREIPSALVKLVDVTSSMLPSCVIIIEFNIFIITCRTSLLII